jgi:hypothetical protein
MDVEKIKPVFRNNTINIIIKDMTSSDFQDIANALIIINKFSEHGFSLYDKKEPTQRKKCISYYIINNN